MPLYVFEARYRHLVKLCLEQAEPRFVITLAHSGFALKEGDPPFAKVGAIVQLSHHSQNPDGTYNVIAHGQDRCRITVSKEELHAETDGIARTLYFTQQEPYSLLRNDPNLERVAAWDALEAFKRYAQMFFAFESRKEIDDAIPEDLSHQASFICANVRVPVELRQKFLEAASLYERFRLVQTAIEERIAAHQPHSEES